MCLLKTGSCLIQERFNVLVFSGKRMHAHLIQVVGFIEVATKTGFTV